MGDPRGRQSRALDELMDNSRLLLWLPVRANIVSLDGSPGIIVSTPVTVSASIPVIVSAIELAVVVEVVEE
jgi:hypothetical protein